MRDREREGVCGVGGGERGEREDDADHLRDLGFVRAAVCGDGALHAGGLVLVDLELRATAHEERDTARVAELGRGLRVLVEEEGLDARVRRRVLADDLVELLFEVREA